MPAPVKSQRCLNIQLIRPNHNRRFSVVLGNAGHVRSSAAPPPVRFFNALDRYLIAEHFPTTIEGRRGFWDAVIATVANCPA